MSEIAANAPVLLVLAACFALGAAIIFLVGQKAERRPAAQELWPLYRSEFIIVGALLIPAALGGWIFALVLLAFCLRGVVELFLLYGLPAWGMTQAVAMAGGGSVVLAGALREPAALLGGLLALAIILGLALFERAAERRRTLEAGVFSLIVPSLLIALCATLRQANDGFAWLVFAYATVEVADSFALLGGKLLGRHRIFPRLSPRKTTEGLLIGIVAGAGVGILLASLWLGLPVAGAIVLTALALLAGLAGDLFTSAVKRAHGQKDFAPVLAQHGGVLDIYDSFLFAAPAVLLFRILMDV